jgi:hypothetical protein
MSFEALLILALKPKFNLFLESFLQKTVKGLIGDSPQFDSLDFFFFVF